LDKLDLTNGAQLHRPIGAVHCSCFDEYGRAHVVTAIDVGGQLVKQVALVGDALGAKVPEVMMRIADWDLRLQRGLLG
jgi:hypothetical protein